MLTRLYIDNFRCFEDFEYKPGPKQLILGANGAGKSSLMDAVSKLRDFVTGTSTVGSIFHARDRTRWSKDTEMRFAIEGVVARHLYRYTLVLDVGPRTPSVLSEALSLNDAQILKFDGRRADFTPLGPSDSDLKTSYPLEPSWSAVGKFPFDVVDKSEGIRAFRDWLSAVECFRINPFPRRSTARANVFRPLKSLSNFASWYRYAGASAPHRNQSFIRSLQESIDGFEDLTLEDAGLGIQTAIATFRATDGSRVRYRIGELSEGQRCLISLYAVLHFVIGAGLTAFIDEPENFIGLREMQPWLNTLSMAIEDFGGQAILISHHPEFLDQWAGELGQRFVRSGSGPVTIKGIENHSPTLSVSELVALGWDDD